MKKLRRFTLGDGKTLTNDELANIEGGLSLNLLDYCTETSIGAACVYYISYDCKGHQTVEIGTCAVKNEMVGNRIVKTPFCM